MDKEIIMTSWWNKNAKNRMDDFRAWVGDFDQPSKIHCRKYIVSKQYKSLIDCGCGLASDYFGFKKDRYRIDYTGLDSCKYFVKINRKRGIYMVEAELEKNLPLRDSHYECVYGREILEHLSYYEKTISEMIRIASKEVILVFFIELGEMDEINYWEEEDLYHNKYDKEKLEKFITGIKKVNKMFWETVEDPTNRKDVLDELNKEDGYSESNIEKPEHERPVVQVKKHILHIILNN
jgi:ubiquinone/menaquinone biosynthesis C-methylase UbiE